MSAIENLPTDDIRTRGNIRDSDVLKLRAAYYSDGRIGPDEAETLFALNNACPVQDPAWSDFFIEAVTDHVVHQVEPDGYLTAANARWLLDRLGCEAHGAAKAGEAGAGRRLRSKTELELLVNVLGKARWSPPSLGLIALEQVRTGVVDNAGPLRDGRGVAPASIAEGEVELVRRILYAFANDGNVALTQPEIALLCAINDALDADAHEPAWVELFIKAMTNAVLSASGYAVPTREEALRREAWLDRRRDLNAGAVLRALVSWSLTSVLGAYREQRPEEQAMAKLERQRIEIITQEAVVPCDAAWLAERFSRPVDEVSPAERAFLDVLGRSSVRLDPAIRGVVEHRIRAA